MFYPLSGEVQNTGQILRFANPDFSASTDISYLKRSDGSTVLMGELIRSAALTDMVALQSLRIATLKNGMDSPEFEALQLLDLIDIKLNIGSAVRYPNVLRFLGYDFSMATETSEGEISEKYIFTYPSLRALNSRAWAIFPSQEINFVNFYGGKYTGEEYFNELSTNAGVLVATDQPYQAHDHIASHTLGLLGLNGALFESLSSLPKDITGGSVVERTQPSLYRYPFNKPFRYRTPSSKIINIAMTKLDSLTSRLTEIAFSEPVDEMRGNELVYVADVIKNYWVGSSDGGVDLEYEVFESAAFDFWHRFDTAEHRAADLMALALT